MRTIIQKMLFGAMGLFLAIGATSCSKLLEEVKDKKTEITVHLKDTDGTPLSGWVVYGFNEFAWHASSSFHAKQAATDSSGKATFVLENKDIKDSQEVYRFVVYYTTTKTNILGEKKTSGTLQKEHAVTVKQGENQTITLQL